MIALQVEGIENAAVFAADALPEHPGGWGISLRRTRIIMVTKMMDSLKSPYQTVIRPALDYGIFECDAFAYLNVDDNPMCAWAVARGVLVSTKAVSHDRSFISLSAASLLRDGNEERLVNELIIESFRQAKFRHRASRLTGMFCFSDLDSACRAEDWGHHFHPDNIVQGKLVASHIDVLDSNWITHAPKDGGYLNGEDLRWINRYWSGEKFPSIEPIWETLADGRFYVFGTDVRGRAVERVRDQFPQSLSILELARAAASVKSDVGNITPWLRTEGSKVHCEFGMNMCEANDPSFLAKLTPEVLVNRHLFSDHLAQGNIGVVPDFSQYEFSRDAARVPAV